MMKKSSTVPAAVDIPARSDDSTSATLPPIIMRYFPRGMIAVINSSTSAIFIIASVASMPFAIELVSMPMQ
ncbi:MAG TPA: hypothetical protein VLM38_04440 [Blastocatellia bacterium]|nr:hypothetical protein [Blastocatellia bacterium]